MITPTAKFDYIPERSSFLELFPHRGSFLCAVHPKGDDRPDWQTENRHLLSDRLITQGAQLYGVRFGKKTSYLMLDIDSRSRFHPSRDPFAIRRILAALEPLGLVRYVPVQSSYSGGIHLYFPFWQPQKSHLVARAAAALLQANGLTIEPGQLELFPNAKRHSEAPTEFNGHRLPLQSGSYLLGDDWEPVYSSRDLFVERWNAAENDCFQDALELAIKRFERRQWGYIRASARKFLNDLNAEIEEGWTGYGQTNRLIGRIALREYVFFHVLTGGEPLSGGRLHLRIIEVAIRLPGFRQWCKHVDDIEAIAFYWTRSVETSPKYYPYGGKGEKLQPDQPVEKEWNQQKAADARQRIKAAVEQLLSQGQLPTGAGARAAAISKFGISCKTLYKNRDLWHPDNYLEAAPDKALHTAQGGSERSKSLEAAPDGALHTPPLISFISSSLLPPQGAEEGEDIDPQGGVGGFPQPQPPTGVEIIRAALNSIRDRQVKRAAANDEPPPDENWFARLRESPPLAGHGKDPTRVQPYLPFDEGD
jgi:hypothetical protein